MADADRKTKRRKLDTTPHSDSASTPTSQRKSSSIISKKTGFPIRATERVEPRKNGSVSGKDAWAEVKARGYGLHPSQKKAELDVYDDIDGAHPPPKKPASSGTKKERLDPLRNQRAQPASSPIKKPSNTAAAGFFKQFHAPREEGTKDGLKSLDGGSERPAYDGKHDSDKNRKAVPNHPESRDGTSSRLVTRTDQDKQPRVKAADRWSYESGGPASTVRAVGNGRRKTFEDEIRELEEAAKRKAEQEAEAEAEEDNAEETTAVKRRTGRGRKSVIADPVQAASPQVATAATGARSKAKQAAREDAHEDAAVPSVHAVPSKKIVSVEAEDTMEIDESEDEVVNSPRTIPAKTLKARTHRAPISQAKARDLRPETLIAPHQFKPDELQAIQLRVMGQLAGRRPVQLTNLDDEHSKVATVISQTITAGESNSMLLIGARGSGKTALVNQILRQQASEHADDFHVVLLNGFIHTDDKIALREIWRQLGREMELDDGEGAAKNYADTLTTLLALLSHPAEQGREQPDHVTKSVIFILDEFELFATHPRQTLLYNLFDIAQSRKAPIAVLGLTTKIDVSESLEKRVKSRFSHRYVHLGLAKSFAAYRESCKAVLSGSNDNEMDEATTKAWDEVVAHLLTSDAVEEQLRRLYYTTKSIPDFMSSMFISMATLPTSTNTSSRDLLNHLTTAVSTSFSALYPPDNKMTLLTSLSMLQLALLICAARLTAIYNTELVSFLLAYEEYKVLASKAKLQASVSGGVGGAGRTSGKEIARVAWRELIDCGFVIEDGRGGGAASGRVDVGLEELGTCGADLGGWGRWCREI